jgi:hypothetical protein
MKKALLVLLLLAVAGGLFAQATLSGSLYGGFRATSADRGPNWRLGWYNHDIGPFNQAALGVSYTSEDKTLGGNLSIRAISPLIGTFDGATTGPSLFLHTYRGWFTMFDGALKILGGQWAENEFNERTAYQTSHWSRARPGVAAYYYPIDGLRVGFGLNASSAYEEYNYGTGNGTVESDLRYWLGAAYVGDGFGAYINGALQKNNINFALTGYYGGNPFYAALNANFTRLDDFANAGNVALGVYLRFTGVENLSVYLKPAFGIPANGNEASISVALGASYGLDLGGLKGAGIDLSYAITGEAFSFNPYIIFGQDDSYITLDYEGSADFAAGTYTNAIGLSFSWAF